MFLVPVTRETRQLSRLFDDTFERFFSPAAAGLNPMMRAAPHWTSSSPNVATP